MRSTPTLALLLALVTPLSPAVAEQPPEYNRVTLNESAQVEVDNDLLVAVLFAQAEDRESAVAADQVNRVMDWAVTMAREHPEVKVQTLAYYTNAVYNKSNIRGWRVNQSLRLESRDGRLLGDLVAKLQEQMQMQSIGYQVSDERRRSHLDDLTAQALQRFQERASHIAKALGRSSYRIVRININDGFHNPVPIARAVMMEAGRADAAVAPARIEAGTQQINIAINGEIELSDD